MELMPACGSSRRAIDGLFFQSFPEAHPSWMYSGHRGPRPGGHAIDIACSKIASCDFLARAPFADVVRSGFAFLGRESSGNDWKNRPSIA